MHQALCVTPACPNPPEQRSDLTPPGLPWTRQRPLGCLLPIRHLGDVGGIYTFSWAQINITGGKALRFCKQEPDFLSLVTSGAFPLVLLCGQQNLLYLLDLIPSATKIPRSSTQFCFRKEQSCCLLLMSEETSPSRGMLKRVT